MGRLFPPPQFGVPLSTEQMENELPFNAIYGVTPSDKYIPISIDSTGKVNVNATLTGTVTIGEIGAPDEDPFFFGASLQQAIGGAYDDAAPNLTAGQQGVVRLTEARAFHTNLRDSSGNEVFPATEATALAIVADLDKFTFSSTRLLVDGSGVIQPVSGTVTSNQGIPNSLANAWPVKLSDGTNLLGTAAHPVRTDPTGTTTQPISAVALPLPANAAKETGGNLDSINAGLATLNSLVPSKYDYIELDYTGNNLTTAIFKLGGPSGTIISTLTLAYSGSNLVSVTKS